MAKTPFDPATFIDKIHSIAEGGKGYQVVVAGDYKRATPNGPELKDYELTFNLPSLTNSKNEAALGIIVHASDPDNSLLFRALRKKDPAFKHIHTHFIKSITPLHGAPEPTAIQYMSFESLRELVIKNNFPGHDLSGLDAESYWDPEHLRADIIYLVTNQADNIDQRTGGAVSDKIKDGRGLGVRVSPLEVVRKRHQERLDAKALLDMNPGLGE